MELETQPRVALWLQSYPLGAARAHFRQDCRPADQAGTKAAARRLHLPTPTWFVQRFQDVGIQGCLEYCRGGYAAANRKVQALVVVGAGRMNRGILTDWSLEEELLLQYYERPLDAFSLEVQVVCPVAGGTAEVIECHTSRDRIGSVSLKRRVYLPATDLSAVLVRMPDGNIHAVGDACQLLGMPRDVKDTPCILVVAPIVTLLLAGKWHSLVLRATQPAINATRCLAFPTPDWLQFLQATNRSKAHETTDLVPAVAMDEAFLQDLLGRVKRWAPALLRDAAAAGATEEELGDFSLDLQSLALSIQRLQQGLFSTTLAFQRRFGGTQFLPGILLEALLHARLLRNIGAQRDALIQGTRVVVPDSLRPALVNRIVHATPGRSSVYAAMLDVDIATMLYQRTLTTTEPNRYYMWADSSPQGGVDWLVTRYDSIPASSLVQTHDSYLFLLSSRNQLVELVSVQVRPDDGDAARQGGSAMNNPDSVHEVTELLRARAVCSELLQDKLTSHMQVPIGIGSRAGSLEHKLRALLFAFYLERPVANIPVALSSVMSMTTDLGTESGMMDYRTESWQSLMPTWMGLASGLVDDCGAESFQHDGSASLFPQGFVVPGMLHIINNMTLDIDSALEHWATWLEGLRCLVGLLAVRHNRERFIGSCVNGTRHAHLAAAFKCNLPNIVDWRWSIITKVLEPLLKLRWPLVATWSEESFLHGASVAEARGPIAPPGQAGVPQPPQHSAGNKELNAQRLTRVIHNKWWWAFCKMLFTIHQVADQLGSWAESCPCHQFDIETHEVIHTVCRQARMPVGCDGQHADCRMRGRRAFELATGQLTVFF